MKNTALLTVGATLLLTLSACSSVQRNTRTSAPGAAYAGTGKDAEVLAPVAERTAPNARWGQRFSAF